ncbi:hypothetical protein [Dysgonomonas reticulitermitis]
MIKKTLLGCLLLLSIHFYVREIYKPHVIQSQSQWQDNQILAQGYLYSNTDSIENLLIGSSMTLRLIMDSLPNFYRLSFGGEAPRQGLGLVVYKGTYPKRVFIEINTLIKETNDNFSNSLYNPVLAPIREKFICMRDGRQPIPLLTLKVRVNIVERIVPASFYVKNENNRNTRVNNTGNIKIKKQETLNAKQQEAFEETKNLIENLVRNKVEVIFFEMPQERDMDCKSGVYPLYRTVAESNFDNGKYAFLPKPECGTYETTDGIHLGYEEAKRYTSHFKTQVDSLIRKNK